MSNDWPARRFWTKVEAVETDEGHGVMLDGRRLRTPAKAPLALPTRRLAEAVANEWEAVGEEIDPKVMPVTRSANTAIDGVKPKYDEVAAILADYGKFDLLCYRADHPETLTARQAEAWDPILGWAETVLHAPLHVRSGIVPTEQPVKSLAALAGAVLAVEPFRLTALHDLVTLSGSLILGLAVSRAHLTAETAWKLSRVDEDFQIENWGEDEEASLAAANKYRAFQDAAHFWTLVDDT